MGRMVCLLRLSERRKNRCSRYSEREPVSVFCGVEKTEYSYDSCSGLLCVYSNKKGAVDMKIDW